MYQGQNFGSMLSLFEKVFRIFSLEQFSNIFKDEVDVAIGVDLSDTILKKMEIIKLVFFVVVESTVAMSNAAAINLNYFK